MLLLTLAGCASAPRLAETTEERLPRQLLLDAVPFHAQRDYQCGPASLAMVLNHGGVNVDVDTLIPQVFLPGRDGSVQPEMLATTRRHGRIPFVIEARLDALLTELAAGHPVVVMQNLALPAWPMWHYAVAIGFDLDRDELILHSGEEPRRIESFRRFDATWARSERWAFIALPPGELPEGARPAATMEAISAFERLHGAEASLPAWLALAERFPDHGLAHFALGNARHGSGDGEGAIAAFEQAVSTQPDLAVAWLNLGLALESEGRQVEARRALERAAALPGHWQLPARDALESLP
ncbi:PA2778 family cysteine peptidase [Halomonas sp. BM-2019]|uniref:PA2778 family cysteine peptidase n=1 Tax=Halomonas sp. BM-2019 TaxID=2811227 RepID=UPI0031FD9527